MTRKDYLKKLIRVGMLDLLETCSIIGENMTNRTTIYNSLYNELEDFRYIFKSDKISKDGEIFKAKLELDIENHGVIFEVETIGDEYYITLNDELVDSIPDYIFQELVDLTLPNIVGKNVIIDDIDNDIVLEYDGEKIYDINEGELKSEFPIVIQENIDGIKEYFLKKFKEGDFLETLSTTLETGVKYLLKSPLSPSYGFVLFGKDYFILNTEFGDMLRYYFKNQELKTPNKNNWLINLYMNSLYRGEFFIEEGTNIIFFKTDILAINNKSENYFYNVNDLKNGNICNLPLLDSDNFNIIKTITFEYLYSAMKLVVAYDSMMRINPIIKEYYEENNLEKVIVHYQAENDKNIRIERNPSEVIITCNCIEFGYFQFDMEVITISEFKIPNHNSHLRLYGIFDNIKGFDMDIESKNMVVQYWEMDSIADIITRFNRNEVFIRKNESNENIFEIYPYDSLFANGGIQPPEVKNEDLLSSISHLSKVSNILMKYRMDVIFDKMVLEKQLEYLIILFKNEGIMMPIWKMKKCKFVSYLRVDLLPYDEEILNKIKYMDDIEAFNLYEKQLYASLLYGNRLTVSSKLRDIYYNYDENINNKIKGLIDNIELYDGFVFEEEDSISYTLSKVSDNIYDYIEEIDHIENKENHFSINYDMIDNLLEELSRENLSKLVSEESRLCNKLAFPDDYGHGLIIYRNPNTFTMSVKLNILRYFSESILDIRDFGLDDRLDDSYLLSANIYINRPPHFILNRNLTKKECGEICETLRKLLSNL